MYSIYLQTAVIGWVGSGIPEERSPLMGHQRLLLVWFSIGWNLLARQTKAYPKVNASEKCHSALRVLSTQASKDKKNEQELPNAPQSSWHDCTRHTSGSSHPVLER
jgi:hypothetical protein